MNDTSRRAVTWGSGIAAWLGIDFKASLAGIHLKYLLVQPETPDEREWKSSVERAQQELGAYSHLQQTKPASLAYAMHDNPAAQAAWILEWFYDWSDRKERDFEAIYSKKRLLTNILIYERCVHISDLFLPRQPHRKRPNHAYGAKGSCADSTDPLP